MSRHRDPRPPSRTSARDRARRLLAPLDGQRVPGGCEHCDAYQVVTPVTAGVWSITVHHDDWCPWLAERKRR